MDRPRSLVQNAGLWVRSIQPLGCSPGGETRRAEPPLRRWERRLRSLMPIRLSVGVGLLLPVRRLLQPARHGREVRMNVVVVDHLLDGVVIVVADVMPVDYVIAGPMAAFGKVAGSWRERLPFDPDISRPLRRRGMTPWVACSSFCWMSRATAPRWSRLLTPQPKAALAIPRDAHRALGQATQEEIPVGWRDGAGRTKPRVGLREWSSRLGGGERRNLPRRKRATNRSVRERRRAGQGTQPGQRLRRQLRC